MTNLHDDYLSVERNNRQFRWSYQCNVCDLRSNYINMYSAIRKAAKHICKETDREHDDD